MEKIRQPDKKTVEELLSTLERDFDKKSFPCLNRPNFDYFKKRILKRFPSNADGTIYIARERGIIAGMVFFIDLQWDTSIFGFRIGRIEHIFMSIDKAGDRHKFLEEVVGDLQAEGYAHLNCRLGLKEYGVLNVMEDLGFNLADIQLTLSTPEGFAAEDEEPGKFMIREAAQADLGCLREMVKGGFTDTRFVNDPRYPRDGVDRMYAEWVKNSFSNPSERIFVAEEKGTGKIGGFIIGGVDTDTEECLGKKISLIDLGAVSKDYRNHGIFQMLVRHVVRWSKEMGMDRVEVRTQVSNISAMRALMRGGLSEICPSMTLPAGVTMHRWF